MAEEWFYTREGQQAGPVSAMQLRQLGAAGKLQAGDMVWKQGMPEWLPASQVKGLLGGMGDPRSGSALRNAANEATLPATGADEYSAPPAPAPAPAASAFSFDGASGEAAAPLDREPWYYGFIDKYVRIFMFLGMAVATLKLLIAEGSLIVLWQAQAFSTVLVLGMMLVAVLIYGLALLALLFAAGLFLLAVDAGRNLRVIRGQTAKR